MNRAWKVQILAYVIAMNAVGADRSIGAEEFLVCALHMVMIAASIVLLAVVTESEDER